MKKQAEKMTMVVTRWIKNEENLDSPELKELFINYFEQQLVSAYDDGQKNVINVINTKPH